MAALTSSLQQSHPQPLPQVLPESPLPIRGPGKGLGALSAQGACSLLDLEDAVSNEEGDSPLFLKSGPLLSTWEAAGSPHIPIKLSEGWGTGGGGAGRAEGSAGRWLFSLHVLLTPASIRGTSRPHPALTFR